jgi:hypothetical protein
MKRGYGQQEDEREAGDQDVEGDFVGRFLTFRAFDERDHFVEKCFAGIRGDADLDLIGEDFGAAGDGAAVAAGFANDGSAFAGDDGFVHGGDAFDDFAIARNEIATFGNDNIAGAELGSGYLLDVVRCRRRVWPWNLTWFCGENRLALCRGLRPWLRRSWRRER